MSRDKQVCVTLKDVQNKIDTFYREFNRTTVQQRQKMDKLTQMAQNQSNDVETVKKSYKNTLNRVDRLVYGVHALTDPMTSREAGEYFNPNLAICSANDILASVENCLIRMDSQIQQLEQELIPMGYVKPDVKYGKEPVNKTIPGPSKLPRVSATPAVQKTKEVEFSDGESFNMSAPGTPLALKKYETKDLSLELDDSLDAMDIEEPIPTPRPPRSQYPSVPTMSSVPESPIVKVKDSTPAIPSSLRHGFTVEKVKDSPTLESIGLSQRALQILQESSFDSSIPSTPDELRTPATHPHLHDVLNASQSVAPPSVQPNQRFRMEREDDTVHSTLSMATPRRGLMEFKSSERAPLLQSRVPVVRRDIQPINLEDYERIFAHDSYGKRTTPFEYLCDAILAINEYMMERNVVSFTAIELAQALELPESKALAIITGLLRLQRLSPAGEKDGQHQYKAS